MKKKIYNWAHDGGSYAPPHGSSWALINKCLYMEKPILPAMAYGTTTPKNHGLHKK